MSDEGRVGVSAAASRAETATAPPRSHCGFAAPRRALTIGLLAAATAAPALAFSAVDDPWYVPDVEADSSHGAWGGEDDVYGDQVVLEVASVGDELLLEVTAIEYGEVVELEFRGEGLFLYIVSFQGSDEEILFIEGEVDGQVVDTAERDGGEDLLITGAGDASVLIDLQGADDLF